MGVQFKPTPITRKSLEEMAIEAVQAHMDTKARERGYDNILSACTYANSTDPTFKAEAVACIEWRDAVWRTCYNILGEVTAGLREAPTIEELLAELPELVWPGGGD